MVDFKNLALQDVTFVLCASKVPLEEFNVLAHKEFEVDPQIKGSVSIIGQSHVLRLSKGTGALSEILLCVPHDLAAYTPICRTTSLANFRLGITCGGLKYVIRVSTRFGATPDEMLKLSGSFGQNPHSLVFHFPRGHMRCSPITSVEWQIRSSAIVAQSCHTFPDENAWVETRTRICWA
jgi:hypothetical protein